MRHRVYKLDNHLTVFGLEIQDLAVAAMSFFVANAVISSLLSTRINILLVIASTYLITRIWIGVKENVPDKFFIHLAMWLAERNRYYATADFEPTPSVIDARAAEQLRTPRKRRPKP